MDFVHFVIAAIFFSIEGALATITVSSSINPDLSGVYVRGVQYPNEHAFAQSAGTLWLYRRDSGSDTYQWLIGEDIFSDTALAFVEYSRSFSSLDDDPCRIDGKVDNSNLWTVTSKKRWYQDEMFNIVCHGLEPGGVDACASAEGNNNDNNNAVPCVELAGGVHMPVLMLGTAYIPALSTAEAHMAGVKEPEVMESPPAIEAALDMGYQGLDLGAQVHPAYGNEATVGELLAARPGRRRSIFLTTKLSPGEHGFNSTLRGFQRSLRLLRTDTIDLFLIHHPECRFVDDCEGDWVESWRAIEQLFKIGAVRAVGISNFDLGLLTKLLGDIKEENSDSTGIATVPVSLLQNRADPLQLEDPEVLALCRAYGIQYQAYSVLGRQWVVGPWSEYWNARQHPILDHEKIVAIADRLSEEVASHRDIDSTGGSLTETVVSPAQVVLRWALDKGWAVVPKTASPERLESNRRLFHFNLTDTDIHVIDQLDAPLYETVEL